MFPSSKHRSFQSSSFGLLVTAIRVLCLTALLSQFFILRRRSGDLESLTAGEEHNDSAPDIETNITVEPNNKYNKFNQDAHMEMAELGGWWPWVKKFSIFWKYVWPVGQPKMQIIAISSILLAFVNKILVVLSSYYLGLLVTDMSEVAKNSERRRAEVLPPILSFAIASALASEAAIPTLRSSLFMIVKIYREQQLKGAIHRTIMSLDLSFHNTVSSADIIRITSDSQGLLNALDTVLIVLLPNMITLLTTAAFLIRKHGPFMALNLLALVVCYFVIQRRSVKQLSEALDRFMALQRAMDADCHESIQCWETIAGHSKTTAAVERYLSKVSSWVKQWFKWLTPFYVGQFSTGVVLISAFLLGLLLIRNDIFNNRATGGDLAAFVGYWATIISSLNIFKANNIDILEKMLQATRGRRLLEIKIQVPDGPKFQFGGGAICFTDVKYYYPQKMDAVLNGLNLFVAAGRTLSIVGQSGTGKSTMLKLLMGFYEPSSGHIKGDDQNIEEIDITSLRSRIGIIAQASHLFNGTVMDNMRYVNPDATEEQVHEACRKARIHDAIMSRPNGYETEIGDNGQTFSGGQRQQLLVARLLLHDPDIVVLDEATSAMDIETEASVQKAIREAFPTKTVIQIDREIADDGTAEPNDLAGNGTQRTTTRGASAAKGRTKASEEDDRTLLLAMGKQMKELHASLQTANRELRSIKDELQTVRGDLQPLRQQVEDDNTKIRKNLEASTILASTRSGPGPSFAAVARTPPTSQTSHARTHTADTTTDTLYCTIDTSRVEVKYGKKPNAGMIRAALEKEMRADGHTEWRCQAVTVNPRN
ncbi:abc transporter [Colletotrichum tabaci]|uniref:Abc transporter n=1 Tax=Colletotrichum tabaci TaxID=1209068 RepID=A0AAV9SSJ5_9PEZI